MAPLNAPAGPSKALTAAGLLISAAPAKRGMVGIGDESTPAKRGMVGIGDEPIAMFMPPFGTGDEATRPYVGSGDVLTPPL